MSRSINTDLKNPSTRNFEWNGESGGFRYFDKEKGEKGEKVHVPLPFQFLVLDCLSTVRGFDDHNQSGYWANEVRNTKIEPLVVRNKKGIQYEGMYENMNLTGAKFCQSVYIAYMIDNELKIGNLALVGTALSAWIDFRKKADVYKGAVKVADMVEGRKGKTIYQTPVFKLIEVKPETDEQAKVLDTELQEYLSKYFARGTRRGIEEEIPAKEVEEYKQPEKVIDDSGLPDNMDDGSDMPF